MFSWVIQIHWQRLFSCGCQTNLADIIFDTQLSRDEVVGGIGLKTLERFPDLSWLFPCLAFPWITRILEESSLSLSLWPESLWFQEKGRNRQTKSRAAKCSPADKMKPVPESGRFFFWMRKPSSRHKVSLLFDHLVLKWVLNDTLQLLSPGLTLLVFRFKSRLRHKHYG